METQVLFGILRVGLFNYLLLKPMQLQLCFASGCFPYFVALVAYTERILLNWILRMRRNVVLGYIGHRLPHRIYSDAARSGAARGQGPQPSFR